MISAIPSYSCFYIFKIVKELCIKYELLQLGYDFGTLFSTLEAVASMHSPFNAI